MSPSPDPILDLVQRSDLGDAANGTSDDAWDERAAWYAPMIYSRTSGSRGIVRVEIHPATLSAMARAAALYAVQPSSTTTVTATTAMAMILSNELLHTYILRLPMPPAPTPFTRIMPFLLREEFDMCTSAILAKLMAKAQRKCAIFPITFNCEDFTDDLGAISTSSSEDVDDEAFTKLGDDSGSGLVPEGNRPKFPSKRSRLEQARVNEIEVDIANLGHELVALKNANSQGSSSSGYPNSHKVTQEDTGSKLDGKNIEHIRQLGGKSAIMDMLWISNAQARLCFPGIEWKRQGEQADLRQGLPAELHSQFQSDFIPPAFTYGMSNERSNSSSRIRKHLGSRIFGFPPNLFVKADWRLANCHVLAGWMENSDGTSFYTPFTPILYQDGQCDVNHVFLNKALFDVFNVIIRGPSALDHEPGVRSGSMTMDVIWELTEVTPGAIAAAATFARFALSHDGAFQCQGAATKINYEGDFNIYLRYLVSGCEENKRSVKRILRIWNDYFFPATSTFDTMVAAPVQAVNDAFAMLEEDEEVGPIDQHDANS
ncbi:hypothetical protein JB92DRAFT_2827153 [Gautieria morchelliformis]|nr:hypothetical protein JB92DRAFT_2827153 [Gautieria morchelliformis]